MCSEFCIDICFNINIDIRAGMHYFWLIISRLMCSDRFRTSEIANTWRFSRVYVSDHQTKWQKWCRVLTRRRAMEIAAVWNHPYNTRGTVHIKLRVFQFECRCSSDFVQLRFACCSRWSRSYNLHNVRDKFAVSCEYVACFVSFCHNCDRICANYQSNFSTITFCRDPVTNRRYAEIYALFAKYSLHDCE